MAHMRLTLESRRRHTLVRLSQVKGTTMSMKLMNVNINRHANSLFAALADDKGNSVNVTFAVPHDRNYEKLTLEEVEQLAHEAAKKLHT
jgi:hypothetical protein